MSKIYKVEVTFLVEHTTFLEIEAKSVEELKEKVGERTSGFRDWSESEEGYLHGLKAVMFQKYDDEDYEVLI